MFFPLKPVKTEGIKIIIVGAGSVGLHIAQRLSEENKYVTIIDYDIDALRKVQETLDVQVILGSGSNPTVLKNAGIEKTHIFLAVTNNDETNITASLFANALAPNCTKLARIRDEDYLAYPEIIKESLNINMVVTPEKEIVKNIERMLTLPGAVEYGEFASGHVRLVGVRLESGPLINCPICEFKQLTHNDEIMIGAISRNNDLIIPSGNQTLLQDDIVYFIYNTKNQSSVLRVLDKKQKNIKTVCIVGGGNIGVNLAKFFEQQGIQTKLIESNEHRCEALADLLKDTIVLHGNGTDKKLLEEENIGQLDAFIAVTENEEVNILSCLLAKSFGVQELVTSINNPAYLQLVEAIGINHTISPRLSAVNSILHFIRQGGILSTLSVGDTAAELLEILIPKDSALINTPIKNLELPNGSLILSIHHEGTNTIPNGDTIIAPGDKIIMIALRKTMQELEELLSTKINPPEDSSSSEKDLF